MKYFIIFMICLGAKAQAELAHPGKNSTQEERLRLVVKIADKVTKFEIVSKSGRAFYIASSNGKTRKDFLSQKNYLYIKRRFASIENIPSYSVASCPRFSVSASLGKKSVSSCLAAKNKSRESLVALANTLGLLM